MQIVQGQQARHEFVVEECGEGALAGSTVRRRAEAVDDPGQTGAVEVHQDPYQFLGRGAYLPVARGGQTVEQFVDPVPGFHGVEGPRRRDGRRGCGAHPASPLSPVGTCIFSTVLPPPTYMWTPHGRQGSKLRTARMMSMPLKFSGEFSSKIGVFCTASS